MSDAIALVKRAQEAVERADHASAAELFMDAADLYKRTNDIYRQKDCEGRGWYSRSFTVSLESIAGARRKVEFLEKSIQAANESVEFEASTDEEKGNLRFRESNKFSALANIEVKVAKEQMDKKRKAAHLRKASEFKLSAAEAAKKSIGLVRDEGVNHSRTGSQYENRAGFFYYRAWAEEVLENWAIAVSFYSRAREISETAQRFYQKATRVEATPARENNLKAAKQLLNQAQKDIDNLSPKVSDLSEIDHGDASPQLNVDMQAEEGLVQGLVSPMSILIHNSGEGPAFEIEAALEGMIDGELEGSLPQLTPDSENSIALAVLPNQAGKLKLKLSLTYRDFQGNTNRLDHEEWVQVGRPQDERGGTTVIHVHGDNVMGSVIRDSVVQRSSFGGGTDAEDSIVVGSGVGTDLVKELQKLGELHQAGILSESEFQAAKKKLLDS